MKSLTTMWILLTLIVASALAVMTVRHQHRILYDQYHQALEQRDRYQMDWGRGLLELATWTTTKRVRSIEEEATQRLGMSEPDRNAIVLVVPKIPPKRVVHQ